MLETYSAPQPVLYESSGQDLYEGSKENIDLSYYIGIVKRRSLHFAFPFLLVVLLGFAFIAIQRPVFRAGGEILLQSPGIAPDLVHPTVTELTDERFEVFKQRIMAPDNLTAVVEKYNLFPREQSLMSGPELLDLMRERVGLKSVAPDRPSSPTIAFALTFDYEVPALALNVANEFLREILDEDASRRTNNATGATQVLEREASNLQAQYDAVGARIEAKRHRSPDQEQAVSEVQKAQLKSLADLESDLVQKSSVYSDEHPAVKDLKKKIAALKRVITTPQAASANNNTDNADVARDVLVQEQTNLQKRLDDANLKLAAARLGENMEKNQQAQRLRVVQYPELPYKPFRPKKLKWIVIVVALAGIIGAGSALAAEMLDGTIREGNQLAAIVDRHLIVSIPYLSRPGEEFWRRLKFILLYTSLVAVLLVAILSVLVIQNPSDGWFNHSSMYALTGILK